MPTTEIFQCQLKAGSNIGDAQNEAAKVVKAIGDKLKVTPGVQQIQFGMQIEKPDFFQLFVSKFRFFSFFLILSPQTIAASYLSQPPTYLQPLLFAIEFGLFPFPATAVRQYIHTKQTTPTTTTKSPIAGPDKVSFYLFFSSLNLYCFPSTFISSAILIIIIQHGTTSQPTKPL